MSSNVLTAAIAKKFLAGKLGDLKGFIAFKGFTAIEAAAAAALSGHKGRLYLTGLTSLSDDAAEALARHEGHIYLWDLKEISDLGLLALIKRLHHIHWAAGLTKRLKQLLRASEGPVNIQAPKEWVDGRVALKPPKKSVTWRSQTYLSKHNDIPTSLFKWFTSLLPKAHVRDDGYYGTQLMTEVAADLLVKNRGFFEAVRSSKTRESSQRRAEQRGKQMQALGEVASRAGYSKGELELKHKRLAELAAAGNAALMADMLSAVDDGWFYESLLVGAKISKDGRLEVGEPLRRLGRAFAKAKNPKSNAREQKVNALDFAEGVGALALRYAPENLLAKLGLQMDRLKRVVVIDDTLGFLAEHVFRHHAALEPVTGARGAFGGVESLTADEGDMVARYKGDLYLGGLTSLSDAAAEALAKHKGELNLGGLTTLSDAAAESLSKLRGDLRLDSLTTLSDAAAESLFKHKGSIGLSGLTTLSDAAAESLSKRKGDLDLNRLTTLSDAAAESLSKHKGGIDLRGLTTLSDAAAESLSKHKGDLDLNRLKTLSDAAAESLSKHRGYLNLDGLTTLSDAAAESLSKHKGGIGLRGKAKAKVTRFRGKKKA